MPRKIVIPLLIALFVAIIGAGGLSSAAAKPALQPFRGTATPEATVTETITVEPVLSIVQPQATAAIDPEALILEDGWQFPTNLSQSGGTSEPQLVLDSNGTAHVLWADALEGFGYTVQSGDGWREPIAAEYPFYTRRYFPDLQDDAPPPRYIPHLAADGRGQIYAFWIGDDGVLYTSSVPANSFTNFDSWTPRAALSDKALKVSTATGADGRLHVAYIRPQDSAARPAGVYYQRVDSSGTGTNPILLYASRYLRTVPAEAANLQLLAAENGSINAVWDDTLREQVFFARSSDNGSNWEIFQEIDGRASGDVEDAAGPGRISLGAHGGQLLLTWSAGHEPGQSCSQYTSMSEDGGATWSYRSVLEGLPRCFASAQFVAAADTLFLLGTIEGEGAARNDSTNTSYMLAWDGSRWSDAQIQEPLSGFLNPATNQAVRLRCHTAVGQVSAITLLGCDAGAAADSWLLGREVGDSAAWFPPPPIWQGPDEVNKGDSDPLDLQLVTSSDGAIHAFWNEANSRRIYVNSWNGTDWSSGREIITSPAGNAAALSAFSAGDQLFLAWQDTARGLQFSTASTANPSQWSDPVTLVAEEPEASAPSIVADAGGNVFLAYTIPFNEARGAYLLHSADAGKTWSAPIQVFDGPAAGWDVVGATQLARTENGQLHFMWTRSTLPPESIPLALAYSRSDDLGQSWSEAGVVVEGQTNWSELIGSGERTVHRLWSEESGARNDIWHQYSLDSGQSWSPAEPIIALNSGDALATAVDPAQRPHLLPLENGRLGDLVWGDGQWTEIDGLETELAAGGNMAGAANQDGQLMAVFAGVRSGENIEETGSSLFGMWRALELPAGLPEPLPALTPTAPAPTVAPTATPAPTATVFFSTEQDQSGPGNRPVIGGLPITQGMALAFIPVLVIIGLGILIGYRIIRKR